MPYTVLVGLVIWISILFCLMVGCLFIVPLVLDIHAIDLVGYQAKGC